MELICYDYEYCRPCERSMKYDAEKYYRIYKEVSLKWPHYVKQSTFHGSILNAVERDFPRVPRIVLSDIVNNAAISMRI